jgi:ribosome-associated protein
VVVLQTAQQQQASLPTDPKELALALAGLLDRKKGEDIVLLDISGPLVIADFFVIATAQGPRHARALGRELESTMKRAGRPRRGVAGMEGENSWVLLDFDDVVVHIFVQESRDFYALELLWADVPRELFEPVENTLETGGQGLEVPETSGNRRGNTLPGSTTRT